MVRLFSFLPGGVVFDSRRALERDSSRFQFDEHPFGGHHGTFLRAEDSTAYEDEYLSLVSRCCMFWIYDRRCTILVNI